MFFFFEENIEGRQSTGILCSVSPSNFEKVLCHEQVYEHKVDQIYANFLGTLVQKSPILLLSDDDQLLSLIRNLQAKKVGALGKAINLKNGSIREVDIGLESMELQGKLTIADGHHRFQAFKRLLSRVTQETSMFAAITHYSSVNLFRSVLLLEGHINKQLFINELKEFCNLELVDSTHDNSALYIYTNNQWYRTYLDVSSDIPRLASEIFLDDICLSMRCFADTTLHFELLSETDKKAERALANGSHLLVLLPRNCPSTICGIAQRGRLVKQNSTFFTPKFSDCPLLHDICVV